MGILQRYVLREILVDFAYALSVITSIFFIALAAQTLYNFHEFNVFFILQLFPLLVPFSLEYTVPVSVLIATVLTFGRLTAEREILAIRTGGIHLGRIIGPALLVGIVLAAGTYQLNSLVIPYCHRQQTRVKQNALERFVANFDRGAHSISFQGFQLSWSSREPNGSMRDILFIRLSDRGEIIQRVFAGGGRITVNRDTDHLDFDLYNVHSPIDRDREKTLLSGAPSRDEPAKGPRRDRRGATAAPEEPPDAPALDLQFAGVSALPLDSADPARPRESSLVSTTFQTLRLSYSLADLFLPNRKAPRVRERPTHSLANEHAASESPARRAELMTAIQSRSANAFACFAFALIGAPLGILVRKGNRLVAFFVSFLVVSLVYYPLSMAGEALGSVGKVPPVVALWWANGALVALGVVLLRSVFRK